MAQFMRTFMIRWQERIGTTKKEKIGYAIGCLGAIFNVIAFVWYISEIVMGETVTNPVTWWLWLAETCVGLIIFMDRTRDFSKWSTEAVSMGGVVIVSGYLIWEMFAGSASVVLAAVKPLDYASAVTAIAVFVVWRLTRERLGAGFSLCLFQVVLFIAIFPLLGSTLADPTAEPLGPWLIWVAAFVCQALCVTLRWDDWDTLLNPINYAATHALVAGIVWYHTVS